MAQIIFPFLSRVKGLGPLLATSAGAVAFVFYELDFEKVAGADAIYLDRFVPVLLIIFEFLL